MTFQNENLVGIECAAMGVAFRNQVGSALPTVLLHKTSVCNTKFCNMGVWELRPQEGVSPLHPLPKLIFCCTRGTLCQGQKPFFRGGVCALDRFSQDRCGRKNIRERNRIRDAGFGKLFNDARVNSRQH